MKTFIRKASAIFITLSLICMIAACGKTGDGTLPSSDTAQDMASQLEQGEDAAPNATEEQGNSGETDYKNLDKSLFDPTKYDGSLYIDGNKFEFPISVKALQDHGFLVDINTGYDDFLAADLWENGGLGVSYLEDYPDILRDFNNIDGVRYINRTQEDIMLEGGNLENIILCQISEEFPNNPESYVGVADVPSNETGELGDYKLYAEDVIERLGNPNHIGGFSFDDGQMLYYYVYDEYILSYHFLYREGRWKAINFSYMLPEMMEGITFSD